ncbi:hypothetical protein F0562_008686 [Nyssa sinensis]|uniref:Uncharacterized protein n=1 Tax=Nyssa sinensis TaxID=561372 RepID=A0A5J5A7K8_9ASTE|nr:hypothetical protein F0562_008686 [Nyssa sinensis]
MADHYDNEAFQSDFPKKLHLNVELDGEEEANDCPIEEVRLTVPTTDDPSVPALTFRTWVLGLLSCILLAFLNQFFGYRQNQLYISSVSAQIVVLPLGKLMAATLPSEPISVPLTKWTFSLNPGPFNLKEHVLITIFANSGSNSVYAVNIITIVKAFYHRNLHPLAAFLLSQTTQMLGYGWAGLFRKFLVDSPYMWWPANLVQVSLFRTIVKLWTETTSALKDQFADVHTRIMKKNYETVPDWWFHSLLILMVALAILTCEGFGKQLQLPWWGILMACAMALFFTLPIGIITATTNIQPGLNVITELVIGYLYPGKPLANVAFKTYGYISMSQAIMFLQDFKLGHYMKIPPKSMFVVQLVGTIVSFFSVLRHSMVSSRPILRTSVIHLSCRKEVPGHAPATMFSTMLPSYGELWVLSECSQSMVSTQS